MGKIMALIATLAIAAHPAIGWSKTGLTLRQNPQGRALTYGVMLLTVMLFGWLPCRSRTSRWTWIRLLSSSPCRVWKRFSCRGLLLLALNEAFRGRWQIAGIGLGWGGVISTFGLTHALGYSEGAFSFDIMSFAMTGVPALILLWVRERTGSVVWPIILHNFANSGIPSNLRSPIAARERTIRQSLKAQNLRGRLAQVTLDAVDRSRLTLQIGIQRFVKVPDPAFLIPRQRHPRLA